MTPLSPRFEELLRPLLLPEVVVHMSHLHDNAVAAVLQARREDNFSQSILLIWLIVIVHGIQRLSQSGKEEAEAPLVLDY